jgi:hypothetical protein
MNAYSRNEAEHSQNEMARIDPYDFAVEESRRYEKLLRGIFVWEKLEILDFPRDIGIRP